MVTSRRKLRIVFYGTGTDEIGGSGLSPQAEPLRDGLVEEGHDVVVGAAGPGRPQLVPSGRGRPDAERPDVVVIGGRGDPGRLDVHRARLRWWRSLVVLLRPGIVTDAVAPDLIAAQPPNLLVGGSGPGPRRAPWGNRFDRAAVRRADLVVETRLAPLPDQRSADRKSVVVPAGAGAVWFAAAARRRSRPPEAYEHGPLRVVHFAGHATDPHTGTLAATIRLLADDYVEWTMVGSIDDRRRVEATTGGQGKVSWIDPASPLDLPSLVADHDVALGRFDADAGFPWEVVQGTAAGCAVVTASDVAVGQVLGAAATFVPPTHPDALASVLTALAVDPDHLAIRREAARLAAERLTPATVVAPLTARLADSPDIPF